MSLALESGRGAVAQEEPLSLCDAARMMRHAKPKLAERQLERALRDPDERRCAVRTLREIAAKQRAKARDEAATATSYTRCDAGKALLDKGLTEDAKKQYEKAVDAEPPDPCGVDGLAAIEDDEGTLDPGEAVSDLGDTLSRHWPWLLLVLVPLALRVLFPSARIAVQASKDDEELAKAVAAAANAAGGHGPLAAKVAYGPPQALPGNDIVALSKMVKLPATAALEAIMKFAAVLPTTASRLDVSSFTSSGWAVIELDLRRTRRRKLTARIALPIGDDAAQGREVLGLVGGAWLVGHMASPEASPVTRPGNDDAVIFHACFRAATNRYARGDIVGARACHAAMPDGVCFEEAPFAWLGARLNEMMALRTELRWGEAARMADVVKSYPDPSAQLAEYGEDAVRDMTRRRRYMSALVRVDHFYALKLAEDPDRLGEARAEAVAAVGELSEERDPVACDSHDVVAVRAAIRMIEICFGIAAGERPPRTLDQVRDELELAGITPSVPLPLLTGAAYYDAACAATMLGLGKEADAEREPFYAAAIEFLTTALKATPPVRRPRVRDMAKSDAMFKPISGRDDFATALAEEKEPEPDKEPEPEPAGLTD